MAAVYLPDSWLWSRLDFLSPGLDLEGYVCGAFLPCPCLPRDTQGLLAEASKHS